MAGDARVQQEEAEACQRDHGEREDQLPLARRQIHERYFFRRTGRSQNGSGVSRRMASSRPLETGSGEFAFPFPTAPPGLDEPGAARPGRISLPRERCGGTAGPSPEAGPVAGYAGGLPECCGRGCAGADGPAGYEAGKAAADRGAGADRDTGPDPGAAADRDAGPD